MCKHQVEGRRIDNVTRGEKKRTFLGPLSIGIVEDRLLASSERFGMAAMVTSAIYVCLCTGWTGWLAGDV